MSRVDTIRNEDVLQCPLCNSESKKELYTRLRDRLYGVQGEWDYKSCRRCGLIFLDPRPTQGDIDKAYNVYPTHTPVALSNNVLRRLRSYLRRGYIANKFGYVEGVPASQRLAGWLVYLHPGQREVMNGSIMYLPEKCRGRLLDVGSGMGTMLNELRSLGWEVEGVDPDTEAVETAIHTYKVNVKPGTLEDQGYPSNHFDAVTLGHVIEHVHTPIDLLRECWQILKPGGTLVVATPNAESLGHRLFGPNWRVIEPPRHLTVFSRETLRQAARKAGIPRAEIKTNARGANGIFILSRKHLKQQAPQANTATIGHQPFSIPEKLIGHAYQYALSLALCFMPNAGEELLLVAVKDG